MSYFIKYLFHLSFFYSTIELQSFPETITLKYINFVSKRLQYQRLEDFEKMVKPLYLLHLTSKLVGLQNKIVF